MKRLGAAKGTGSGYRNLRNFPKDSSIHAQSAKGMKQPQLRGRYIVGLKGWTGHQKTELFEGKLRPVFSSIPEKYTLSKTEVEKRTKDPQSAWFDSDAVFLPATKERMEKMADFNIKYGADTYKETGRKIKESLHARGGKSPQQPEETAVHELELYTENEGDLYRQMTSPIEKNLQKKLDKGIYDKEKAQKAFLNLVNVAARKYNKEFGSETDKTFTMADRREVAKRMEASFADEVRLGNRYD